MFSHEKSLNWVYILENSGNFTISQSEILKKEKRISLICVQYYDGVVKNSYLC